MDSSGDISTGEQLYFLFNVKCSRHMYCRLHHAASKASVDSSAVSLRLMRCTADTVEMKPVIITLMIIKSLKIIPHYTKYPRSSVQLRDANATAAAFFCSCR